MTHFMNLRRNPFVKIREGKKTVELRLFDEKRSAIAVGDNIMFTNLDSGEKIQCIVTSLYRYPSFEELYRHHDKVSIGYDTDEEADPNDMLDYYPKEKIEKYGVLGIGIKMLSQ